MVLTLMSLKSQALSKGSFQKSGALIEIEISRAHILRTPSNMNAYMVGARNKQPAHVFPAHFFTDNPMLTPNLP